MKTKLMKWFLLGSFILTAMTGCFFHHDRDEDYRYRDRDRGRYYDGGGYHHGDDWHEHDRR